MRLVLLVCVLAVASAIDIHHMIEGRHRARSHEKDVFCGSTLSGYEQEATTCTATEAQVFARAPDTAKFNDDDFEEENFKVCGYRYETQFGYVNFTATGGGATQKIVSFKADDHCKLEWATEPLENMPSGKKALAAAVYAMSYFMGSCAGKKTITIKKCLDGFNTQMEAVKDTLGVITYHEKFHHIGTAGDAKFLKEAECSACCQKDNAQKCKKKGSVTKTTAGCKRLFDKAHMGKDWCGSCKDVSGTCKPRGHTGAQFKTQFETLKPFEKNYICTYGAFQYNVGLPLAAWDAEVHPHIKAFVDPLRTRLKYGKTDVDSVFKIAGSPCDRKTNPALAAEKPEVAQYCALWHAMQHHSKEPKLKGWSKEVNQILPKVDYAKGEFQQLEGKLDTLGLQVDEYGTLSGSSIGPYKCNGKLGVVAEIRYSFGGNGAQFINPIRNLQHAAFSAKTLPEVGAIEKAVEQTLLAQDKIWQAADPSLITMSDDLCNTCCKINAAASGCERSADAAPKCNIMKPGNCAGSCKILKPLENEAAKCFFVDTTQKAYAPPVTDQLCGNCCSLGGILGFRSCSSRAAPKGGANCGNLSTDEACSGSCKSNKKTFGSGACIKN